jgi:hypothetical protein
MRTHRRADEKADMTKLTVTFRNFVLQQSLEAVIIQTHAVCTE